MIIGDVERLFSCPFQLMVVLLAFLSQYKWYVSTHTGRSFDRRSSVDGVSPWVTQNSSPEDDVCCSLQPTKETIDTVETISKQAGKCLVFLPNPQWCFVDDSLAAFWARLHPF